MDKKDFDVIIIGGGAAGISAALWCDELGLKAVLLESASELGGQLLWTYNRIENHLGIEAANGREMRDIFLKQIKERDFLLKMNSSVETVDFENKTVSVKSGQKFRSESIIIATGVRRRKLSIEGEEKFQGKGIIKSGKRDGKLVEGKIAAIIGGGDAAFENSLILSEFASEVFLIHRSSNFKARTEFLDAAQKNPKIKILTNTEVRKITGADSVEILELENTRDKTLFSLPVNFLLIRIGVEPNTDLFRGKIELNEEKYIKINSLCETNIKNVYAVGDVANPVSPTISTSVGMGATAVKAIFSR